MAITVDRARLALETAEDVFTAEGDAVVIERVHQSGTSATRDSAYITGKAGHRWVHLSGLTAREDLR